MFHTKKKLRVYSPYFYYETLITIFFYIRHQMMDMGNGHFLLWCNRNIAHLIILNYE